MNKLILDILTSREAMLKALVESRTLNSIIGIHSKEVGEGTYLTSVKDILFTDDDADPVIVLENYDSTGYFFEKNVVPLSAIQSVIPFKSVFQNPFLKEIEKQTADRRSHAENQTLQAPDYLH
jgi:hypothetical protein